MSPSLIVNLLAERPERELQRLRDEMRATIARTTVELEQVEDAIARQARRGGSKRSNGNTRQRVLATVRKSSTPVSPAEIIATMEAEGGGAPSGGAVYNMLGRLLQAGEIQKVGDGRYQAASPNGSLSADQTGPSEIGTGERLSPATQSHETARQDA